MKDWFTNLWETMKNTVMANWHMVLRFLLVLVLGAIVIRVAISIIRKILNGEKSKLKGTAANFLTAIAKAALICLYVIILLATLGVDTTSLVAIFSVLTLAISLSVLTASFFGARAFETAKKKGSLIKESGNAWPF